MKFYLSLLVWSRTFLPGTSLYLRLCLHGTGSKRDQMDLVQKSDRIGLLSTQDLYGTGPERIPAVPKLDLQFCRPSFGSVWIRSGPVP